MAIEKEFKIALVIILAICVACITCFTVSAIVTNTPEYKAKMAAREKAREEKKEEKRLRKAAEEKARKEKEEEERLRKAAEAPAPRVVEVPPQPPPEAPVPLADLSDMSVAAVAAKLGVDVPEPDPKGPPDLAWAPGNVYYLFGEPLPGGPWVGGYWQNPKDGRAMYVQAFFSSSPPSVSTAEAYAICGLPLAGYKEYSNPNPRAAELGTVLAHDTLPGKYIDVQLIKAGSDEVMFIRVSNERGYVYFQDVLP